MAENLSVTRDAGGYYDSLGLYGYWWSSTENSTSYAWGRFLHLDFGNVYRASTNLDHGFSVRCVRDN
jgi:uncharacterized protein (TIGR02145 family)